VSGKKQKDRQQYNTRDILSLGGQTKENQSFATIIINKPKKKRQSGRKQDKGIPIKEELEGSDKINLTYHE
jgi:hypothetical protein